MRRIDWIMIIALVFLALAGKFGGFTSSPESTENPRRPKIETFQPKFWDAETRAWLSKTPSQSKTEIPAFEALPRVGIIEDSIKGKSTVGSAFSISEQGLWLTARHVAAGCQKTYIQTGDKQALTVTKTAFHPNADIALLTTRGAPKALEFANRQEPPQNAYGIGFPTGQPGAVYARYLGEMTMQHGGRSGYREQVYAWSEQSRIPARPGSLGGLSGGAVLDDQGHIIGVVQAESRRRGRIMTAKPKTIQALLAQTSTQISPASTTAFETVFSAKTYPTPARELITRLRVARVLCFTN